GSAGIDRGESPHLQGKHGLPVLAQPVLTLTRSGPARIDRRFVASTARQLRYSHQDGKGRASMHDGQRSHRTEIRTGTGTEWTENFEGMQMNALVGGGERTAQLTHRSVVSIVGAIVGSISLFVPWVLFSASGGGLTASEGESPAQLVASLFSGQPSSGP